MASASPDPAASFRDVRPVYSEVMEDGEAIGAALAPSAGEIAVCVASAGDNVFALALAPVRHVFGVDVNPVQIDLCRLSETALRRLTWPELAALSGVHDAAPRERRRLLDALGPEAPPFTRDPETVEAIERSGLAACGRLSAFVAPLRALLAETVGAESLAALLRTPERSVRERIWRERFARPEVVELLARALNRETISDAFIPAAAFDRMAAPEFHLHYHAVLRRLCVEQDPCANRFLHRLWLGQYPLVQGLERGEGGEAVPVHLSRESYPRMLERLDAITWHQADLLQFLRTLPEASVSLYNLSNVLDWSSAEHHDALWREVDRTATDGARVALRSFLVDQPPPGDVAARWSLDLERSRTLARADRVGYFSRYELWSRARSRK